MAASETLRTLVPEGSGFSSQTLFTHPTKPSIDLRKSTGLLYASIRRTSGVNHIGLSSPPQPYPIGEFHFHRPWPRRPDRGLYLDKLPFARLAAPDAPIPLFKPSQRQPFLRTELLRPHPTLALPRNKAAPLRCTPLDLPIAIHLHTTLL